MGTDNNEPKKDQKEHKRPNYYVSLDGSEQYRQHGKYLYNKDGERIGILRIRKLLLKVLPATVVIPLMNGQPRAAKHVKAETKVDDETEQPREIPAYDLFTVCGIQVHARDGLQIDKDGNLTGRVQVAARVCLPVDIGTGEPIGVEHHYLSLNVFPNSVSPIQKVVITRRKVEGAKWQKRALQDGTVYGVSLDFKGFEPEPEPEASDGDDSAENSDPENYGNFIGNGEPLKATLGDVADKK